jgi:hypothetical protein
MPEGNCDVSILVAGSEAVIEGVYVRDTQEPAGDFGGAGIAVQAREENGQPANASMSGTAINHSHSVGLLVNGASLFVDRSFISDTQTAASGMFGDGLLVVSSPIDLGIVEVSRTVLERSARAGISNHSAQVSLSDSLLLCQAFELDGEIYDVPFTFVDLGGNGCGCPDASRQCQVVSSELEPPAPIADPPEGPNPDSQ